MIQARLGLFERAESGKRAGVADDVLRVVLKSFKIAKMPLLISRPFPEANEKNSPRYPVAPDVPGAFGMHATDNHPSTIT
jgi:hypothetical protein